MAHHRFDFLEVVCDLDATPTVGVLAWLDDPDTLFLRIELLAKGRKLRVCLRLDMEGQRDGDLEGVQSKSPVILAHVEEEGFFVTQVEVVLNFVVDQSTLGRLRSLFQKLVFVGPTPGSPQETRASWLLFLRYERLLTLKP